MQDHSEHLRSAAEAFLPHGFCYLWDPALLWTHVVADLLIGFAYVAISTTLVYLVWKGRREFPFQGMFIAFGLFIIACGATHFVEIYTLWTPAYWFSAGVKVVTAAASVGTALLLPPLVPRFLDTVREARLSEERRVQAESAERFRVMAEAMPLIVWTADPRGAVEYYNRRWHDYTGIPVEQGHGWGWQDAVHPDDAARTHAAWDHSISTGEPYEITHRIRAADGSYRWLLSRGVPMRGVGGAITRWCGSATDVDAQKRAEEAQRAAKEEAEAANRAKSQFLSTMSHELRTPLNAIAGHVDLIEAGIHGPVTPAQMNALQRVKANQGHLLSLINDVLNFARIEAGHLSMTEEEVPVPSVISEMVSLMEPQIHAAHLECRVTPPEASLAARADRDRLQQILLNLLGNAVKFTPDGGRIEIRCEGTDEWVLVRVSDTGRGVPAEMVQKIFDPFVQLRNGEDRDPSRQGVGLGLAISRDLARAMGGELEVESTLGSGSTFTLRLPRWRSATPVPGGGAAEAQPPADSADSPAVPA